MFLFVKCCVSLIVSLLLVTVLYLCVDRLVFSVFCHSLDEATSLNLIFVGVLFVLLCLGTVDTVFGILFYLP